MIKKTTLATFKDGGYAGQYDWKGGIPLSVGEVIDVTTTNSEQLAYRLTDKSIHLTDNSNDQNVVVNYFFELNN